MEIVVFRRQTNFNQKNDYKLVFSSSFSV